MGIPASSFDNLWHIVKPAGRNIAVEFKANESSFYIQCDERGVKNVRLQYGNNSSFKFWITQNNEIIYKISGYVRVTSIVLSTPISIELFKDGGTPPTEEDGVVIVPTS